MQVYTHVYNQYLTEEHFGVLDSELKECPSFVGK